MSGNLKRKHEITITYIMMCIVTIFLITQCPYYLHLLLRVTGVIKPKFGYHVPIFTLTTIIFGTLNSTVNTMIYCIFNKKFRDVLFQWCPLKCLTTGNNVDDTGPKPLRRNHGSLFSPLVLCKSKCHSENNF